MSTTVVAYLERNLETADEVAVSAARDPKVQRLDPRAAADVLRPLVNGDKMIRNAVIADDAGRAIAWASSPRDTAESAVSPEWLANVVRSGQRAVSPVLSGPDHNAHVVLTGYPISGGAGSVVGVLALAVHLESLEQVFATIPLPADSVITVTDARSVVVARSLDSGRFVGRPAEEGPSVPRSPVDVPTTDVRVGLDGVERVYGNLVVARGPWLVSVGIPTAVAQNRTAPIDCRNFLIMVGALTIVLGLSLFAAERGLKALTVVGRTSERVAKGDLSPLEPRDLGSVEVNQLHQSLAAMITSLRSAQDAVAAQVAEERRVREEKESLQRQFDPAGASGGDRRPRLGCGPRAQQPAAGDPRLRRAAGDAGGAARPGEARPRADSA